MKTTTIDPILRQATANAMQNDDSLDRPASSSDLTFLRYDDWLLDAHVSEYLVQREGLWHIYLVYADVTDPTRFVSRYIDSDQNNLRLQQKCSLMKRTVEKDPNQQETDGTSALNFCRN